MGVARSWIQEVEYRAQLMRGMRNHFIPGARRRWMVVMKLMPVSMDEKPRMKAANTARLTLVPVFRLKGA